MLTRVLCASDGGSLAPKLYRHAAGLAAATGGSLAIVHAADSDGGQSAVARILDGYLRAIPYARSVELEPEVFVSSGPPVEAILASAHGYRADVIVCGSRRRGAVASWFLGSTTRSLLEHTATPMFVVPDNDVDVITVSDAQASLHFGTVIAAIDRAEANRSQLSLASRLAQVSAQPLALMTVIEPGHDLSIEQATEVLRERAHGLAPVRPRSLIVRRGDIAHEIVACCDAEHAGVVVMGLHGRRRGQRPGAIATAVLARGRAAVLAVCGQNVDD